MVHLEEKESHKTSQLSTIARQKWNCLKAFLSLKSCLLSRLLVFAAAPPAKMSRIRIVLGPHIRVGWEFPQVTCEGLSGGGGERNWGGRGYFFFVNQLLTCRIENCNRGFPCITLG